MKIGHYRVFTHLICLTPQVNNPFQRVEPVNGVITRPDFCSPRSVTKDEFSIARLEITENFFFPWPFTLNKDFY